MTSNVKLKSYEDMREGMRKYPLKDNYSLSHGLMGSTIQLRYNIKSAGFMYKLAVSEKDMRKAIREEQCYSHFMSLHDLAVRALYGLVKQEDALEKIKAFIEEEVFTPEQYEQRSLFIEDYYSPKKNK